MALMQTPSSEKNWSASDFYLEAVDGKFYNLASIKKANGLVIVFICNHCPYVKAIADKLAIEARALNEIEVGFLAINSNDPTAYPEDSFAEMKNFAKSHNFSFPYCVDPTQAVAKSYGAVCTPDFFAFNAAMQLQYRGRLDSSGREKTPVEKRELFDAMKEIAATTKFTGAEIASIGCSIKWID